MPPRHRQSHIDSGNCSARTLTLIFNREVSIALLVLALFALAGEQILGYLNVEQASLSEDHRRRRGECT